MPGPDTAPKPQARQRILESAYKLFSLRGIRAVGIDEIIAHAGVAKATLYRHFPSKDALVLAFMQLREERWTVGWMEQEVVRRGETPEERLFAILDVFDEWFHSVDFEGCPFINTLLEMSTDELLRDASSNHLEYIRSVVRRLGEEAGLRDPDSFAHSWQLLMKGSVVAACGGDIDAAKRARSLGVLLVEQYRPDVPASAQSAA